MRIRRVVSLTMLLGFAVMVYTGILLFLSPQGRVAYWTGWSLMGLSKTQSGHLHTTFMVVFITAGIWHIVLNWKPILNYLRTRSRQMRIFTPEFSVALALVALFAVGTLAAVPPWSAFLSWEDSIKGFWERRDGSPPWGHAEENTLARFTRGLVDWERIEHQRAVSLTVPAAVAALREAGLAVEDGKQRLVEIARANGTTPQAIMAVLRKAEVPIQSAGGNEAQADPAGDPFPEPYSGLGRMTLGAYCDKYGLEIADLLALLPEVSSADAGTRFKELAGALGTDPHELLGILNERARAGKRIAD